MYFGILKKVLEVFLFFQLYFYFQISRFYFQVGLRVPLGRTITPTTNVVRVSIIITVKSMVLTKISKKFHFGADILLFSSATY